MLDIPQILKTANAIISRSSENTYSGITIGNQAKPSYNHNTSKTPLICKLNLDVCKCFYNELGSEKIITTVCPFGFSIKKKSFEVSTIHQKITIYSIINYLYDKRNLDLLYDLPRDVKRYKADTLSELEHFYIDEKVSKDFSEYLENLIETLLVGRIGISLQGLSHQIFTPLQGALSDLQNIRRGNDKSESLNRLEKNFEQINKIASELQLLLSPNEEFNRNMLRKVTVHNMIADIFTSLKAFATEKFIRLEQQYNKYGKVVEAIPGQLHIVLTNIIHNAIKYSYKGYIDSNLYVNVSYSDIDNKYLVISIQNEGCKLTSNEISDRLIFDLGYRGVYSSDRQRQGTGTGLYIADVIAKTHKGKINVDCRLTGGNANEGTDRYLITFNICWPYYIDEV